MPPPCTHTPSVSCSVALLLCPDKRQVILISFSSNGLFRTSAKLLGTCPTVVASRLPYAVCVSIVSTPSELLMREKEKRQYGLGRQVKAMIRDSVPCN